LLACKKELERTGYRLQVTDYRFRVWDLGEGLGFHIPELKLKKSGVPAKRMNILNKIDPEILALGKCAHLISFIL